MSRTLSVSAYPNARRVSSLVAALSAAALCLLLTEPASAHHSARPHAPKPRVVATSSTAVVLAWKRTTRTYVVSRNWRVVARTTRTRFEFKNLGCDRRYRLGVRALTRSGTRSRVSVRWVETRPCAPPPPTTPRPPASAAPPTITGVVRAGRVLHATAGEWTGSAPISHSVAWLRCNTSGASCMPVTGATGANYLLGSDDVGATMRVEVTATNAYGSAAARSARTAVVAAANVGGVCSRADATGCAAVAGSRISLLNQRFSCDRSLASIAAENPIGSGPGRLPLLVEVGFTTYVDLEPAVVELKNGCYGDGNDDTIDLVIKVEGDGRTIGGGADAVKVRLTARDVQLTGYANCGPRGVGPDGRPGTGDDAHQDGAQIQGGERVEFIDFEWGDWETSTATCQGAAGTFVPGSVNGNPVVEMACIRCKSVSCNHGMFVGGSMRTLVVDSSWRSGNPADRTVVLANGQVGLCNFGSNACTIGEDRAFEYTILRNHCDRWPYGDGQ